MVGQSNKPTTRKGWANQPMEAQRLAIVEFSFYPSRQRQRETHFVGEQEQAAGK